jgi:hypothetical protein
MRGPARRHPGRSGGKADAAVSNTAGRKVVWVRIPPSAPPQQSPAGGAHRHIGSVPHRPRPRPRLTVDRPGATGWARASMRQVRHPPRPIPPSAGALFVCADGFLGGLACTSDAGAPLDQSSRPPPYVRVSARPGRVGRDSMGSPRPAWGCPESGPGTRPRSGAHGTRYRGHPAAHNRRARARADPPPP